MNVHRTTYTFWDLHTSATVVLVLFQCCPFISCFLIISRRLFWQYNFWHCAARSLSWQLWQRVSPRGDKHVASVSKWYSINHKLIFYINSIELNTFGPEMLKYFILLKRKGLNYVNERIPKKTISFFKKCNIFEKLHLSSK